MIQKLRGTIAALIFIGVYSAADSPAKAVELIINGGFETGDTGWTKNVQLGSDGNFFNVPYAGGITPLSSMPFQLNIAGGNRFSVTDAQGPGSYALTQAFTIAPGSGNVNYSFQTFANNWATVISNGSELSTRDFSTPTLVQNAVVDIIKGSADPFTNLASDIIATLFALADGPADSSVNPNPWTTYAGTLSLAPGTYKIRFAETDNVNIFNQGVDNVSLSTSEVPLPAALPLFATGLGALGLLGWWRKRKAQAA